MNGVPEGNAVVYCQGAFATTNGKTAHGLVRRTERYRVLSVIDSRYAGKDAGRLLDGTASGIPMHRDLPAAVEHARGRGTPATHLVMGLTPDGGRLSEEAREAVKQAIVAGLHVDSGLHDLLTEDPELAGMARSRGVRLRDVRKTPPRSEMHFFSGKIEEVVSLKVAVLGTDSAVGKRTTAWMLVDAFRRAGMSAQLIGTGQTSWMQGAEYCTILDALVVDFVTGEIEHLVWRAWREKHPEVIVIEGQGSLLNPAYPGGMEILSAGRPQVTVLQHAPSRKVYDGFPAYPLHPLDLQIRAVELLSGRPVGAVTVNHEGLTAGQARQACRRIEEQTGLPAVDPLVSGVDSLVPRLREVTR